MELKTARLLMRPLNINDLASTHEYTGDVESIPYMLYFPALSIDETRDFLARSTAEWAKPSPAFYEFAIELDQRNIGEVGVYLDPSRSEGELGWLIHRDFRGNGYVSEAAEAVKYFSISILQLKRLYACCDARNLASRRIMEKLGMKLELSNGTRVNRDGNEAVEFVYSLLV